MIDQGPVIDQIVIDQIVVIGYLFTNENCSRYYVYLTRNYITLPCFSSVSIMRFLALRVEGVLVGQLKCYEC